MVTGYFSFAHNMSKRRTEVYHKMGLVILYKIVWQILNANEQGVLRLLCKKVNIERFFLFYDNMNFYKKVQDQKIHNKNHQVAYITRYVCFIKCEAFFLCHTINYEVVKKPTSSNFLLIPTDFQHQTKPTCYMLSQVISWYFGKEICKERIIINGVWLPKYRKWLIPLKKIQCVKEKANILPLPTLLYNKSEISETIDILKELIQCLNLDHCLFEDKIVMVEGDWLAVWNIIQEIY